MITLLPVLCLLLFGGATLKDFAFALLIGILSGAYSSIFVASPILTLLKEREPQYRKLAARADEGLSARLPLHRRATLDLRSRGPRPALEACSGCPQSLTRTSCQTSHRSGFTSPGRRGVASRPRLRAGGTHPVPAPQPRAASRAGR